MNLPDWLSLSATSGTGSGKITATVDKCTARAARRTTEFSVKTDSGSSRRVRVIQNGIAEFVNITTQDINIPDTVDDSFAIAVVGTSNSAILTFTTSGSLLLTNTMATVTDENGNNISFISGSPIDGDPGASAMYSYTLVFKATTNTSANELKSTLTVSAQSGASASINISQAAGSGAVATLPYFTNNSAREVPAAGTTDIGNIVVYNPGEIGWDILAVPNAGINISEGSTENYLTPIVVRVDPNTDTESGKSFVLYLVPEGAVNTSVVYSSLVINQLAAPVNPYIEGDALVPMRSYTGALVALNVVDQKNVGWYPSAVYRHQDETEFSGGTVYVTGIGDADNRQYTFAELSTVFNDETHNTKIIGDGVISIMLSGDCVDNDSATISIFKSVTETTEEPYDYAVINISNVPQFDLRSLEVVMEPNSATGSDSLTIANPGNVPFIIQTTGNRSSSLANLTVNGQPIYDTLDAGTLTTYTDSAITVDIVTTQMGQFNIVLTSADATPIAFDTIPVGIYRRPVIRFARQYEGGKDYIDLHVTERLVNTAQVYSNYGGYVEGIYSEQDLLSGMPIAYSIESGNGNAFTFDSSTGAITGIASFSEMGEEVIVKATVVANDFYKEAEAVYAVRIWKTNAYLSISGFQTDTQTIYLYLPGNSAKGMPSEMPIQYQVYVDRYTSYGECQPVLIDTVFPDDAVNVTFQAQPFGGEELLVVDSFGYIPNNILKAKAIPTDPNDVANVTALLASTTHYKSAGLIGTGSKEFFTVEVLANTDFVLSVVGPFMSSDDTYHYIFDSENMHDSGPQTTPYSYIITLKNGTEGNYVDMPHTLEFYPQNYTNPISTESGDMVIYDGDFLVKRNSSDTNTIDTSSLQHTVDISLKTNAGETESERTLAIKAYVEGYPYALGVFRIAMWQDGSVTHRMYFNFANSEIESWYEQGYDAEYYAHKIYPNAGSGQPFDIKLFSTDSSVNLNNTGVYVQRDIYTYDSSTSSWIPDTQSGWLRLLIGPYECDYYDPDSLEPQSYSYQTDSEGYPKSQQTSERQSMTLEWNANTDQTLIRKAVFTFTASVNGVETEPVSYEFVQLNNTDWIVVRWERGTDIITGNPIIRELEKGFSDTSSTAYLAKCYTVNSSSETEVTPTSLDYSSSNEQISVGPYNGLAAGYVSVDANATTGAQVSAVLVYGGETYNLTYEVQVATRKEDAEIVILSEPTASYENALNDDILVLEAYSTSGSEVSIIATDGAGRITPTTSYTYVAQQGEAQGKTVTSYQFKIRTASSSSDAIAGTNAVTFAMTAAGTDAYKPAEDTYSLSIARADDTITNWDVLGYGLTVGIGTDNLKQYKISTRSGIAPVNITAKSSTAANATLGYPLYNDKWWYQVIGRQNGSFIIEATMSDSGPNFKRPTTAPSVTLTISGTPIVGRQLKLLNSGTQVTSLSVAVGETVTLVPSITYSVSSGSVPSAKPTPLYTISNDNSTYVSAAIDNGNLIITGESTSSNPKSITLNLAQQTYGGMLWSSSSAEISITVGMASNSIIFSKSSVTINENESTEVTVTALYGTPTLYVPTGLGSYVSVTKLTGNNWRINGLQAKSDAYVHASVTGTDNYAGAGRDLPVTVNASGTPTVQECYISFNATYANFSERSTKEISGTGLRPSNATVTYTSASPSSVSIFSSDGANVTLYGESATGSSKVKINVKVEATGYTTYNTSFLIGVNAAAKPTDTVTITNGGGSIYVQNNLDYTYQKTLSASSAYNLPITWSTSSSAIATVNAGVVTGVAPGVVTITATSQGNSSYNGNSADTNITILAVPGSSQDPDPDGIEFDNNIALKQMYVTETYYNGARTSSERVPVRYASSDVSKINVVGAKVTASAAASDIVLTMTLGTSPTRTYTCKVSVASGNSSKNGQTIDVSTNNQSISAKTGDVFYIYPSVALGSGSYIANNTWVSWSSANSTKVKVNGGLVKALAVTSGSVVITASYPADTNYEAATGTYSVQAMLEEPQLAWTYQDGVYYFTQGQTLAQDFNVATSNSPAQILYESTNTGIVEVGRTTGLITFGSSVGDSATIRATQAATGKYSSKTIEYIIYVNAYAVHFFAPGSSTITNQITLSSPRSTLVTFKVQYWNGNSYYNDNYSYLSTEYPISSTNPSASTINSEHQISVTIPVNTTGQERHNQIRLSSGNGATATLDAVQPAGESSDPELQTYVITRSDSTDVGANHYYAHTWMLGFDSAIYSAAGTDEDCEHEYEKLSHSGQDAIWLEAQQTYQRMPSGTSIRYQVLISTDNETWSVSSSSSWFRLYFGDGNYNGWNDTTWHSGSTWTYGTGSVSLGTGGKLYPHIAWTQNDSGAYRYGKVIFYIQESSGNLEGRFEASFCQRDTAS